MDAARDSLQALFNMLPRYEDLDKKEDEDHALKDAVAMGDHVALSFVCPAGCRLWEEAHRFHAIDAEFWRRKFPTTAVFLRRLGYVYLKHRSDTVALSDQTLPDDWIDYAMEDLGAFDPFVEDQGSSVVSSKLGATRKALARVVADDGLLSDSTPSRLSKKRRV